MDDFTTQKTIKTTSPARFMGFGVLGGDVYCVGGGGMNDTITIQNPQDVPAPTLQQVYKYAELHKLQIVFNEFDSVQLAVNRVCHASICKTQREIYDEMVGL